VTNPEEVIAVEDKVKVKVMGVDEKLKRIQLSIKAVLEPPPRRTPKDNKGNKNNKNNKNNNDNKAKGNKGRGGRKRRRDEKPAPSPEQKARAAIDSLKEKWGAK
jgi:predicted RNA-binding protein with RPS1 domain